MGFRFLQALWFVTPVLIAGLVHVGVIKLGWLPTLAGYPLDMGARIRGRRVLGDHKTVRGAVVMIGTAAIAAAVASLAPNWISRGLAVAPYQIEHPGMWGILLGVGYIGGELPNSLIKRQLGIAPGAAAGRWRVCGWICDQLDSVAGVFILLCIVWRPEPVIVAVVIGLALLLHPFVAALMVALGLKERIG